MTDGLPDGDVQSEALHGEYKVPGGKLVVVDLRVEAGRIAGFRLAGDFFLEPDVALEAISAAESMAREVSRPVGSPTRVVPVSACWRPLVTAIE